MTTATTMILEVKHLQLVEAVAAYGSLTNAGKHLHLTQSALSHQLGELERRLGTPLFHRVGRRLVPTLAGDRLLRSATRALSILRRTESSLKRIAAGHEALLRFSTACYTTYHWLSPLLEEYARRCPKVEVQVVAEATRRPIEALLAGKIDVGIVSDVVPDDRIEFVPLFDDEVVLIVPPTHRLAMRSYVTAQDFVDEHLLVYTEPRDRQFDLPSRARPRRRRSATRVGDPTHRSDRRDGEGGTRRRRARALGRRAVRPRGNPRRRASDARRTASHLARGDAPPAGAAALR